jgi:hypothetical protein
MPDYKRGSVVNLLSSIIRSRGGRSPHAELDGVPARSLASARHVIYLLVDGLGEAQLTRLLREGRGRSFFGMHPRQVISTVFPATTAAAVTTFGTGASPAEHGVLGWHLHLHDLGLVSTILLTSTRTGSPMAHEDFDLGEYLCTPSHIATVPCRKELLSWAHIPRSRYSRANDPWTFRGGYRTLTGMVRQVATRAARRSRSVSYVYWPEYDSHCHEYGCFHRRTVSHFMQIDRALAQLVRLLQGTDTALIVTADHGLVDTSNGVELREVEGFYDHLAALPSGDARQVQCFVRPARVESFLDLVQTKLSRACVCVPGSYLLRKQAFGLGKPHRALENRVGDYTLLARPDYSFASTLPGAESSFNKANHGGMSAEEVRVPLYAIRC